MNIVQLSFETGAFIGKSKNRFTTSKQFFDFSFLVHKNLVKEVWYWNTFWKQSESASFCKNRLKAQFHTLTGLIFLFYFRTVSLEPDSKTGKFGGEFLEMSDFSVSFMKPWYWLKMLKMSDSAGKNWNWRPRLSFLMSVSSETLLMVIFGQKTAFFGPWNQTTKKNTTQVSQKKKYHFWFQKKCWNLNLKPLWVSKKLTQSQNYEGIQEFVNEKRHVFESKTRPVFDWKTCLFFEKKSKYEHLEHWCAILIKNWLVKSYKLE